MSYTQKLTTFTKGNQLSNCGKYNLEDLDDMFCDTQFSNNEDKFLEDVLIKSKSFSGKFDLSSTVTIMEQLDDDEMNMYMLLEDDDDKLKELHAEIARLVELDNKITERVNDEFESQMEIPCSAELDYEFQQQSE